jgi:hypothetical protein
VYIPRCFDRILSLLASKRTAFEGGLGVDPSLHCVRWERAGSMPGYRLCRVESAEKLERDALSLDGLRGIWQTQAAFFLLWVHTGELWNSCL